MQDNPACVQLGIEGFREQQLRCGSSVVKEANTRSIKLDDKVAQLLQEVSHKRHVEFFMFHNLHHESNLALIFMNERFKEISLDYPYLTSFVSWNNIASSVTDSNSHELCVLLNKVNKLVIELYKSLANNRDQDFIYLQQQLESLWQEAQKILLKNEKGYRLAQKLPALVVKRETLSNYELLLKLINSELYKDYEKIYITNDQEFCSLIAQADFQVITDVELSAMLPLLKCYHQEIASFNMLLDGEDIENFYQSNYSIYQDAVLSKADLQARNLQFQLTELKTKNSRLEQENEELRNQLRQLNPIVAPQNVEANSIPTYTNLQPRLDVKQYQAIDTVVDLDSVYQEEYMEGLEELEALRKEAESKAKQDYLEQLEQDKQRQLERQQLREQKEQRQKTRTQQEAEKRFFRQSHR